MDSFKFGAIKITTVSARLHLFGGLQYYLRINQGVLEYSYF